MRTLQTPGQAIRRAADRDIRQKVVSAVVVAPYPGNGPVMHVQLSDPALGDNLTVRAKVLSGVSIQALPVGTPVTIIMDHGRAVVSGIGGASSGSSDSTVKQIDYFDSPASTADYLAKIKHNADTYYRLELGLQSNNTGQILWGSGSAAGDVRFWRNSTKSLNFDDGTGLAASFNVIGNLQFSGRLRLTGVIAPTISANQNDWAPTGLATCTRINCTVSGATRTVTGFDATGFSDGQGFWLYATGGNAITLSHSDALSASGNRINGINNANVTVTNNSARLIVYDSTLSATAPFRVYM